MERQVYLDNSATTRPFDEVIAAMTAAMGQRYYNPSSLYRPAMEIQRELDGIRTRIADLAGGALRQIIFTSGGTESDNMAIRGRLLQPSVRGKHIITTSIEHPAVANTFAFLEKQGFRVDTLGVGQDCLIDPQELRELLTEDTALVSVMQINNETGACQPIEEIGEIIKAYHSGIAFHVDGVQGFGRMGAIPDTVDLYSLSAHKIHGPKGIGALLLPGDSYIQPIGYGGGQEGGLRSGTENTSAIIGMGVAVEQFLHHGDEYVRHMQEMRAALLGGIHDNLADCFVNGSLEHSAPHIINVSFMGVRGETLLHGLEEYGIYVSTGSACSSHSKKDSPVLTAMGLSKERRESAVRFSLCPLNTMEDVAYTVDALKQCVERFRKFRRK